MPRPAHAGRGRIYHGDEQIVWQALEYLEKHKVQRGINFVALKPYMPALPFIALTSDIFGAELLVLTAKGVKDVLPSETVMAEARKLHQQGFKVAVDGLTCAGELPDYCMQKRRFCDVDSQGNVMPCSFMRTPIGNLLEKPFSEIWRSRGGQVSCPFVGGEEEGAVRGTRSITPASQFPSDSPQAEFSWTTASSICGTVDAESRIRT